MNRKDKKKIEESKMRDYFIQLQISILVHNNSSIKTTFQLIRVDNSMVHNLEDLVNFLTFRIQDLTLTKIINIGTTNNKILGMDLQINPSIPINLGLPKIWIINQMSHLNMMDIIITPMFLLSQQIRIIIQLSSFSQWTQLILFNLEIKLIKTQQVIMGLISIKTTTLPTQFLQL